MAQVINTDSLSLITQNNINKNQSALSTSIERLSSGLRINSAKADAAGQAIANRFTSIVKGLTQKVVDDCPDAFIASQQLLIVYNNKVTGVDVNPSEYYLISNTLDIAE